MEKLLPWFHLKSVPGIGNHIYKRLIDHFGSPEQVLTAPSDSLLRVEGVSQRLATSIRRHKLPDSIQIEMDQIGKKGYRIIPLTDRDYPALLREIPDPPPFLYVYGHLDGSTNNVAIVGSRNATAYGISTTKRLSASLASLGITIVSGMAMGVDTAAHEGTLQAKGRTIAVLGSGLERIYPAANRRLYHEISQSGAVVSEFSLRTEPEAYNFPIRNRVISGLSLGTIVVEATRKSGSLITARMAAEQNREVFAVPGSVRSFKSMGTHTLIKQGAKLVENAQDVLDELTHRLPMMGQSRSEVPADQPMPEGPPGDLSPDEQAVYDTLGPYPIHVDEIVRETDMAPGTVLGLLMQLELKLYVIQSPGKRFSISS